MGAPLETLREKLQSGALPREPFVKTWRGHGTGKPCDVCESPITHIEYEVEGDRLDGGVIRFHTACYDAWWCERVRCGVAARRGDRFGAGHTMTGHGARPESHSPPLDDGPAHRSRQQAVIRKLKGGLLPRGARRLLWTGFGTGQRICMGCEEIISRHDNEIELELAGTVVLVFHRDCFETWEHHAG